MKQMKQRMKLRDALRGKLSAREFSFLRRAFDTVGTIAILEIPEELKKKEKVIAQELLRLHSHLETAVKKVGAHRGELRLQRYALLAGKRSKETVHRESGLQFHLHLEKTYFSPRLVSERLRIAQQVQPGEEVLVLFSGIAPYDCVIARHSKAREIVGIELNPAAHRFALENVQRNRLTNILLYHGDVRVLVPQLARQFDRVLMPLPKGGETFLNVALSAVKKGGVLHFYDFLAEADIPEGAEKKVLAACTNAGRKCTILRTVRCGQLAVRQWRVCVDARIK